MHLDERGADAVHVVRRSDDADAGVADELRGGAVRRDDREDWPFGGDVLEDLPGEDAAAAAGRLRNEEEQRLALALQLERAPPGHVVDELDLVREAEPLHELAIARPK